MTEMYPWYGSVQGEELEQGDLFVSCPLFRVTGQGTFRQEEGNVVVLSHSCDLTHDKLELVQVCPYWTLEFLAGRVPYLQSVRGREDLRRGNVPGYHLLNRCHLPGFESDFLVVDFRSLYGVHLTTIRVLAAQQSPRVRLLPPYREHLAQAFARFFMRVGLPVNVPAFR
jgi:hypothetical protein